MGTTGVTVTTGIRAMTGAKAMAGTTMTKRGAARLGQGPCTLEPHGEALTNWFTHASLEVQKSYAGGGYLEE
jgi:hypothetical protein